MKIIFIFLPFQVGFSEASELAQRTGFIGYIETSCAEKLNIDQILPALFPDIIKSEEPISVSPLPPSGTLSQPTSSTSSSSRCVVM